MHKRAVLHVVGVLTVLAGVAMLLPAIVGAAYREAASIPIAGAAAIALAAG